MSAPLGSAEARPASAEGAPRKRKPRGHPLPLTRHRYRTEEPFLLIIADHDNRRFTVEGPMTDAEHWTREVIAARRAGRQITCRVATGTPDEAAKQWRRRHGGQRWPSGLIVAPPDAAPRNEPISGAASGRAEGALQVTPVMVLEALRVLYRANRLKVEALGENEALVEEMLRSALATQKGPSAATS
jgi:hypothetical protein